MTRLEIFGIFITFIIGMAGVVFAGQILWPDFFKRGPTYVTENKQSTFYVQENTAMRDSVQDVLPATVAVKTKTASGEILAGSALVLTSDGLIVTLASLVPKGSEFSFFVDAKWPAFQILKRDQVNDLALIKVEAGGLKSRGFADLEKIKLAEPVFLAGFDFASTTPQNIVNAGIVAYFNNQVIQTNITEKPTMAGSPLFNIEGKVVGLSVIADDGRVWAIPADIIRTFAGF